MSDPSGPNVSRNAVPQRPVTARVPERNQGKTGCEHPAFDNSVRIGYARVGTRVQDHQAPAGSASCGALS